MNEEAKVSKCITKKLERYLNRERVERRFDSSGQGFHRSHPLVVKLELAYLIANEDQKMTKEEQEDDESHMTTSRSRRRSVEERPAMPRVKKLPQKKTRVQMSEVNRLTQNAHSTLKQIDAEKINTVYRFRQQMVPYQVRHEGKIKQVSTNVHAMLNAEEAWRYRRDNDEREKVQKYREQEKAKAKELAAKDARAQQLAKLPPGIRMEIQRQNDRPRNQPLLQKLLETNTKQSTPPSDPLPQHPAVLMATKEEFTDAEDPLYEDDFEEEEDEEDKGEQEEGEEDGPGGPNDAQKDETKKQKESENDEEAFIAAVKTANDVGSVLSYDKSISTSPSPSTRHSHTGDRVSYDDGSNVYDDDSFDSDTDEQGAVMTNVSQGGVSGSESNSKAPSYVKSAKKQTLYKEASVAKNMEDAASISSSNVASSQEKCDLVKGHTEEVSSEVGSVEFKLLAHQLARTAVKNAAHEEGGTYSSSNSTLSRKSVDKISSGKSASITSRDGDESRGEQNRKKTQEYVRTESVVSLSDRVKMSLESR